MPKRKTKKRPGLKVQSVPVADLHLDPENARLHDEANLAAIRASIKQFGQVEPLVVQLSSGRIIGGNGRFKVLVDELGATAVDVVYLDIDDAKAKALGLALNRTAELAAWDEGQLANILDQLDTDAEDLLGAVGFGEEELRRILSTMDAELDAVTKPELADSDEGPDRPKAPADGNWFYAEFYGDDERFERLRGYFTKEAMLTGHEIAPAVFEEMVELWASKNAKRDSKSSGKKRSAKPATAAPQPAASGAR